VNSSPSAEQEIASGQRFAFGSNWARFLRLLDDTRIAEAEASLKAMLGVQTLAGKSFLDIGSGSGLFSLAARRLGARVHSLDFDPQSVACTLELRKRYFAQDALANGHWQVEQGSALDPAYLQGLGLFDVVYSWGVLHHTGQMWKGLDLAYQRVAPGGTLFVALYNHQPFASRYWTFVKKTYNRLPMSRPFWIALHTLYPLLPSMAIKAIQQRKNPRGMNLWYDLLDWLGGYPFEVATPGEVFSFYRDKGFVLTQLKTVGGRLGCNEFVFRRI
jgi:SAM-dependent methyltransferase